MFKLKDVYMEEAEPPSSSGDAPPPDPAPSPPPSDWRTIFSEENRDSPSLQDVPDADTFLKNYEHTKAMVGNSVRLPTDDAGQESIDKTVAKILENRNLPLMRKPDLDNPESLVEVQKALGRPDDVSGYAVPDDVNGELFGSLSEKALELGLTKKQYEGMAAALGSQQMAEYERMQESKNAEISQVKGEWGPAFDQKVGRAAQVAEALGAPKALIDALKDGSANAEALRFMDNVATQLGTEGSQIASQVGQVTEDTVAELHQRRTEIFAELRRDDLPPSERDAKMKRYIKINEQIAAAK